MNIPNPAQVASARTARLVREAQTPVYSTSTPTAEQAQAALVAAAEEALCTPDYCFVCSRCTDHFAEHTPEQLLSAYRPSRVR